MSRSSSGSSLVTRRLYRSLLSQAKHFTPPSTDAVALTCLISRTGLEDGVAEWNASISKWAEQSGRPSLRELEKHRSPSQTLFQQLLREVVSGPTISGGAAAATDNDEQQQQQQQSRHREFMVPSQVDTTHLYQIIRREFRDDKDSVSRLFDVVTRRTVAFQAIKELDKKIQLADSLKQKAASKPLHPHQAARNVAPLSLRTTPSSSYLRPGAFLLAHPHLTGLFARSVICILEHRQEGGDEDNTYGLIINKNFFDHPFAILSGVIQIDDDSLDAFENATVREGGPVHPTVQLVYSRSPGENVSIGGTLLPTIPSLDGDDGDDVIKDQSLALDSDREVYFQGDFRVAAQAVSIGELQLEDVCFYVGASVWSAGQLEDEVNRGVWIPCRAPTSWVVTGKCEHEMGKVLEDDEEKRWKGKLPKEDLWLSMMCALGEDEGKLAHLTSLQDKFDRQLAAPCDQDLG